MASDAELPFDVPIQEFLLSASTEAGALADAVEAVAFNAPWGQFVTNTGDWRASILAMLERRYNMGQASGITAVAWRALSDADTGADFADRLESLLTMLPGGAPQVLFPAWPASFPDGPGVFHITPFRSWSVAPSEVIREISKKRGANYMRGDGSQEQRIIRAVWSELGRATMVVADMTELNPNVSLELGIAHALGKPTLLLYNRDVDADGPRERKLFESIAKDQVHAYSSAAQYASLRTALQFLRV